MSRKNGILFAKVANNKREAYAVIYSKCGTHPQKDILGINAVFMSQEITKGNTLGISSDQYTSNLCTYVATVGQLRLGKV
jgi:hypothetical protein